MKEKIKLVIVFILGIMISVVISVYAATVISAGEVSFNGSTSNIKYNGTTAANVSDAINGVYSSANTIANELSTKQQRLKVKNVSFSTSTIAAYSNINVTKSTILSNAGISSSNVVAIILDTISPNASYTINLVVWHSYTTSTGMDNYNYAIYNDSATPTAASLSFKILYTY